MYQGPADPTHFGFSLILPALCAATTAAGHPEGGNGGHEATAGLQHAYYRLPSGQ